MVRQESLLVRLVDQIDRVPLPQTPCTAPGRGRPCTYSNHLMLKALAVMVSRRLYSPHALLAFLEQDDIVAVRVRACLHEHGRFPSRRTWERRLNALVDDLPRFIAGLGCWLVTTLKPWGRRKRATALDSTALRTSGGVWHKKHREAGQIPHSKIDTQAGWSKSGWHGWWYGWKLHLAVTAGRLWIPVAAELTVANTSDNTVAPALLEALPAETTCLLGDSQYIDPKLMVMSKEQQREWITPQPGPYPHKDPAVEYRRALHKQRSRSIEPFNGLFKSVFELGSQVPVRGLVPTRRLVLGAVFLYQIILAYQYDNGLPIGKGIKPLLRAA
jgi:hypothetical protein